MIEVSLLLLFINTYIYIVNTERKQRALDGIEKGKNFAEFKSQLQGTKEKFDFISEKFASGFFNIQ